MWSTTCAAIAEDHTAITLDARGHGKSDPHGEISVEQYATDALTLLDHIGVATALVIGLSMGGQAAMHLALRAPQRVRGLVLADTSLGGRGGAAERMAQTRARIEMIGAEAFAEEYTRSRLMSDIDERVVEEFASLVLKTLPDIYVRQVGSIASQDLRATALVIAAPTLVIVGANDVSTPPQIAEQLRKAIPGAGIEKIAAANHLSNLDRPDAFNGAVAAFLRRFV